MDRQSDVRSVELNYKARRGELIDRLTKAGHHPKVTVVLLGQRAAVNYRVRLSCTRCQQTLRNWPLRIWLGLGPTRPCPGSPERT